MLARARGGSVRSMARYLSHHRQQPPECGIVFASFKGNVGPLRHRTTLASCPPADTRSGGRCRPKPGRTRSGCCPSMPH